MSNIAINIPTTIAKNARIVFDDMG